MKKIGIGLLAVVVIFVVVVLTRPATFHIERSATMQAPPEVVFAEIDSFKGFVEWSPWDKMDKDMKKSFSGPDGGVGASYEWSGNDKVGQGRMTIIESKPAEKVAMRLEFIAPWQATNTATWTLKPEGGGTKVTWAMDGNNDFMGKAASMFMNMDALVGKDFEDGLNNLKTLTEAKAKTLAAAPAPAPTGETGVTGATGPTK